MSKALSEAGWYLRVEHCTSYPQGAHRLLRIRLARITPIPQLTHNCGVPTACQALSFFTGPKESALLYSTAAETKTQRYRVSHPKGHSNKTTTGQTPERMLLTHIKAIPWAVWRGPSQFEFSCHLALVSDQSRLTPGEAKTVP